MKNTNITLTLVNAENETTIIMPLPTPEDFEEFDFCDYGIKKVEFEGQDVTKAFNKHTSIIVEKDADSFFGLIEKIFEILKARNNFQNLDTLFWAVETIQDEVYGWRGRSPLTDDVLDKILDGEIDVLSFPENCSTEKEECPLNCAREYFFWLDVTTAEEIDLDYFDVENFDAKGIENADEKTKEVFRRAQDGDKDLTWAELTLLIPFFDYKSYGENYSCEGNGPFLASDGETVVFVSESIHKLFKR